MQSRCRAPWLPHPGSEVDWLADARLSWGVGGSADRDRYAELGGGLRNGPSPTGGRKAPCGNLSSARRAPSFSSADASR